MVEAGSFCHPTKPAATARYWSYCQRLVMAPQIIQFPGGAPPAPLPATLSYKVRPRHDVAGTAGRAGRGLPEKRVCADGIDRRSGYGRHHRGVGIILDRRAGRQSRINVIGRDAFRFRDDGGCREA